MYFDRRKVAIRYQLCYRVGGIKLYRHRILRFPHFSLFAGGSNRRSTLDNHFVTILIAAVHHLIF